MGQYSHDLGLPNNWNLRLSVGGNFLASTGFAPNARISLREAKKNQDSSLFFEVHTLNKMPTLSDRHYLIPTIYIGNKDLMPERVNGLIAGIVHDGRLIKNTATLKTEYRNQIQVGTQLISGESSLTNQGNAWLVSLSDDVEWKPVSMVSEKLGTVFTASRVSNSGYSYPDLPAVSFVQNGNYQLTDDLNFRHTLRYIGESKNAAGAKHADYFLTDLSASYEIKKDIVTTIGCDNVFDSRAEVILDYPLPGRIAYLNLQMNF